MTNSKKVTGKKASTAASKILTDWRTSAASKSAAGSALWQRKAPKKQTSAKVASTAAKVVKSKSTGSKSKTAAGSALAQKAPKTPPKKK